MITINIESSTRLNKCDFESEEELLTYLLSLYSTSELLELKDFSL